MRYLVSALCLFLTASAAPAEDALPHHTILLYRTGGAVNLQYITWSNTLTPKPQFHVPERFGVVHFDSRPVLSLQDDEE